LVAGRDYLVDRYLAALQRELRDLPSAAPLKTLYLGGGTPTHLSDRRLALLFEMLRGSFELAPECEVTIEANPNDLSLVRGDFFRQLGINRLSLGVQSLRDHKLKALDRSHTKVDVFTAVEAGRAFASSISVDLIFAAPEESPDEWQAELEELDALKVDHVSTYELTYERGTRFWSDLLHGRQEMVDEDNRLRMYECTIDALVARGFEHYEISSFAHPGHASGHNQVYWSGEPYLAIGPGASGFYGGVRYQNAPGVLQYLKRIEAGESPVVERDDLTDADRARELLAIGLRRMIGVEESRFAALTGFTFEQCAGDAIPLLVDWGLLQEDWGADQKRSRSIRLTDRGKALYDTVAVEILRVGD
jgi:oxygen-independent coproporphyrinogen-3 oxidase